MPIASSQIDSPQKDSCKQNADLGIMRRHHGGDGEDVEGSAMPPYSMRGLTALENGAIGSPWISQPLGLHATTKFSFLGWSCRYRPTAVSRAH